MEHWLNKEQMLLCGLLEAALHTDERKRQTACRRLGGQSEQIFTVLQTADRHRVLPLLYDTLDAYGQLDTEERSFLEKRSRQTVQQSYRLLFLGKSVIELLEQNGIRTILLKGSGTAGLYPVPELRKSGDIDLLLEGAEAAERAQKILQAHGFLLHQEQHARHHRVLVSPEGIEIELHELLAEPYDSEAVNQYLRRLQAEYFFHVKETELMGVRLPLPAAPYHAFYLLLHMLQHFLRAGFGLKLLSDWVVFWEREYDDACRRTFLRLVKESKTLSFAQAVTAVCIRYLGLSAARMAFLPGIDRVGNVTVGEFIIETFEAEEFGKSAPERMVMMRGTRIRDYVREFHHQTRLTYPKAGERPLFLPGYYVATLFGFLYRNRTVRKVSGTAVIRQAARRSRLAEKLRLFQE